MTRIVVTADPEGVPTAEVPLSLLWDLARCMPAQEIVVTYHHATHHALVMFPGWDVPTMQEIMDDLCAGTTSCHESLAVWPELHCGVLTSQTALAGYAASDRRKLTHEGDGSVPRLAEPCREPHRASRTGTDYASLSAGEVLAEMRRITENLAPAQQDRLSELLCAIKASLAAERECLHRLFEAAPDGHFVTDAAGKILHANAAAHDLLEHTTPLLNGLLLPGFLAPASEALVLQRLRLLRTGICQDQPFTDIHAQLARHGDHQKSVSMRLIALLSADGECSTIRWLIRSC